MSKRFFGSIDACHFSLIFIGLMFSLPFVNMLHAQPMTSFYTEWIAGALGLIALFPLLCSTAWSAPQQSFGQTTSIQSPLRIPRISLIFLGLGAILCVQWALGMLHSSQYTLTVLSYFIWAFLLIVLSSYLRNKLGLENMATTLAWGLVVAGIINIGIVVLQFVVRTGGVVAFLPNLSSFGALSQTNHFADFCALAITSLIYLYAKRCFSFSFFSLILVLFMIMLSFSGSRSAWLYLIALTFLIAVMHRCTIKQNKESESTRSAWRAGILLLPIFVVVQLFIYFVIPNEYINLPTERLFDGLAADSASARLQFWYDSLRIFLQSPWLGVGAGKLISNTFLLIDAPTVMASKRIFEHAHNLFMQLLAEMGIFAFLIVFAGLFSWAKAFKWRDLNLETWWLISLLAILSIHSMLEYPLWFTFFLGIAAVLLGAGDEKFISINIPKCVIKFSRIGLIIVWILGAINITTLLISNIKLESWIQKFAYENVNDLVQLNWVQKYSLLSPYSELMHARSMIIDPKLIDEQFLLNQSVVSFRPIRTIAYQHALLLELKGRHEDAVKQLNRTLIAYPNTFKSFLENPSLKYRPEYLNLYAETQVARATK
ncbi:MULTISPECIES: PglL family O-oligosaccharyltransferase [Methylotenera]|uniref:PglL family O-oligosaccharyltransferase n=1 Tax=Methylotenera TaxID=359407 RepID=UPI0003A50FD1|nr:MULTISPECIES: O-antigen ligase family protein [Methylotenera]